jgi:carbon-monoxide dehydrogenase small subunit
MTTSVERDDGKIRVNGEDLDVPTSPRLSLLDYLREAGFTGTHMGCEHGVCGACTVLLDDEPVRACLVLAVQAEGHSIQTVEGLGTAEQPTALQHAFSQEAALQCGFCTPGFLMVATALLRSTPNPTDEMIDDALSSNLCRCTSYAGMRRAVRRCASSD